MRTIAHFVATRKWVITVGVSLSLGNASRYIRKIETSTNKKIRRCVFRNEKMPKDRATADWKFSHESLDLSRYFNGTCCFPRPFPPNENPSRYYPRHICPEAAVESQWEKETKKNMYRRRRGFGPRASTRLTVVVGSPTLCFPNGSCPFPIPFSSPHTPFLCLRSQGISTSARYKQVRDCVARGKAA